MPDPKRQAERFKRAVRAACSPSSASFCDYPNCPCETFPIEIERAILAWEELPAVDGEQATR